MLRPVFPFDHQLPPWLRPAGRGVACILELGAGLAGKLYLLLLLGVMVFFVGLGHGVLLLGVFIGLAMAAAAVGGAIHGLLPSLEEWGRGGSWLRTAAALFGAILAFVAITPRGPFTLGDPELYFGAAVLAAAGAGYFLLLDDRRPGRPTPRRLEWLQNRERLWAKAERRRVARGRDKVPGLGGSAWVGER